MTIELLDDFMKEIIQRAALIYEDSTNNWLPIKRFLLNTLTREYRRKFSNRDPLTKKHILNDFDKAVIDYWFSLTGIQLIIPEEKVLVGTPKRVGRGGDHRSAKFKQSKKTTVE